MTPILNLLRNLNVSDNLSARLALASDDVAETGKYDVSNVSEDGQAALSNYIETATDVSMWVMLDRNADLFAQGAV